MTTTVNNETCDGRRGPEKWMPSWLPLNGLNEGAQSKLAALGISLSFRGVEPGYVSAEFPQGYHVHTSPDGSFPSPTTVLNGSCEPVVTVHWGDSADRLTIVYQ